MTRRNALYDVIGLFVLCALVVCFWQARLNASADTEVLSLFGSSDQFNYFYPMHQEAARRLAKGDLPLWNPWQLAGLPFLATQLVAVLYPPNLLYLVLTPEHAMETLALFHLLLAAALLYSFGRALGLSRTASMVGGLVYSCSAFLAHRHLTPPLIATLAWIPGPFISVARIHRGGGAVWCAALMVSVAMLILSGYVIYTTYALQALALYFGWNVLLTMKVRWRMRAVLREATWVGVGVVGGFCLSAPQWLPTMELADLASRGIGGLTDAQLEPYGSFLRASWESLFVPGKSVYGDLHIGLAATLLLLPGLSVRGLRTETVFFLGLGLLAALLALGSSMPIFELYKELPWGRWFRMPERWVSIFVFAASIASSLGVEAILSRGGAAARWRAATVLLLIASCATFFAAGLSDQRGLVLLVAFLFVAASLVPARAAPAMGIALLALVFWNLFSTTQNRHIQIWQEGQVGRLHAYDHFYQRLRKTLGMQRAVVGLRPYQLFCLFSKQALIQRVFVFEEFDRLVPRRYGDYLRFVESGEISLQSSPEVYAGLFKMFTPIRYPRLLAAAGVALIAEPDVFSNGFFEHPVEGALPRSYIVHGVRAAIDSRTTLKSIAEGELDISGEVILESPPPEVIQKAGPATSDEKVRILRYAPEAVDLEARLDRPGVVVLLDADFPGWKAHVNGTPVRIYNANYLFRAILLPAGTHHIAFRYAPRSFAMGLALGASGGVALLVLIGFSCRARRASASHESSAASSIGRSDHLDYSV